MSPRPSLFLHPPSVLLATPRASTASPRCIAPTRVVAQADPILEGDLIVHRPLRTSADDKWTVVAVTSVRSDCYMVRPIYTRHTAQDERFIECFLDWSVDPTRLGLDQHAVALVDAAYEPRVIQDRVENPHGELSEDCWKLYYDDITVPVVPIPIA